MSEGWQVYKSAFLPPPPSTADRGGSSLRASPTALCGFPRKDAFLVAPQLQGCAGGSKGRQHHLFLQQNRRMCSVVLLSSSTACGECGQFLCAASWKMCVLLKK
ncbi:hypothetical protein AV530_004536 [Patagioenas fasciata monilis]|uniref:Uncharacterized protein n=1 Tax=Patagioenas fasciata monilis TaxID=372326 RepID=A0A1V4J5M6_PATFA|nr:hypothetical protein AV530_004536 [Patagioenas fasciata monilis]